MLISPILWFRANPKAFGTIKELKKVKRGKRKQQVVPWRQNSAGIALYGAVAPLAA